MATGVVCLGYMAFSYFALAKDAPKFQGKNHRLGASNEVDEMSQYAPIFNSLSVAIWGLVVTKAKSGMEAASNKDANTVGGIVKKVGAICALIAGASMLQLMANMNTASPVEAVTKASGHKLQASKNAHPDSYYNPESSHYQGGAHNVLLNFAKDTMSGKKVASVEQKNLGNHGHNVLINVAKNGVDKTQTQNLGDHGHNVLINIAKNGVDKTQVAANVPSQSSMGGAHNVAMAVLSEQSRKFQAKQKNVKSASPMAFFGNFQFQKASDKQFSKNLKSTGAFVAFIATLSVCVAFYVTLKTFHAHLEKADSLNALMKNPNARVAVGAKGKKVVQKIMAKKQELDEEATPEQITTAVVEENTLEALILKAKAKKALQEAHSETLLSGYSAPKIVEEVIVAAPVQQQVHYQLVEPMVQQQPQFWYPQNFEVHAPQPMPMPVQKVAIMQPEPMREPTPAKQPNLADMPKAELIRALLAQIAKEE